MKVEVHNLGDSYELTAAVLVYTNPTTRHAFASKHEVARDGGRPVIRPGTPLGEDDYKTLVGALAPREQPRMHWRDPRLLAQGLGRMLWWTPPQHRALFFRRSPPHQDSFDGRGRCACPGLVFLTHEGSLLVFAVKGRAAPTPASALFQAPFFNVWSQGQVCVGNAVAPQAEQREDLDAWERMFFGSHFTHPNFTQPDRLTVGVAPADFWQGQLRQPTPEFPEEVLFPLELRLGDLLTVDSINQLHGLGRAQGEF
jgi:PRTRC genetic system protein B